jgi:hypothetical protein
VRSDAEFFECFEREDVREAADAAAPERDSDCGHERLRGSRSGERTIVTVSRVDNAARRTMTDTVRG